jgi:hypothetical protein
MAKFLSDRQQSLKVGISSYTENNTVLQTIGKVGIGTTNAGGRSLYVIGDTEITGIVTTGSLKINSGVYDVYNNVGVAGSILVSTGAGVSWTKPYAAGLQGIQGTQGAASQGTSGNTVQGAQGIQGTQGAASQGTSGNTVQGAQGIQGTQGLSNQGVQGVQGLSNQGAQGIQGTTGPVAGSANQIVYKNASNTATGNANFLFLNDSTFIVGAASSTGTASQPLQVTGGAYVSGSVGIGTTNPTSKLSVEGDARVTGIITATTFSGQVNSGVGTITTLNFTTATGSNIVGTALSVAGISTLGVTTTTNLTAQQLNVSGFTTSTSLRVTGVIQDSTGNPGTSGQVLQSTVSGTQWTTASAGGSGKFDTTIDNVLYVQPTGTLDIVGVGTTTTQITTLPAGTNEYIIHSMHVTNISNGDAEITAGFVMNARKVPATISVSVGSSGGSGIHTFTVGSASSITVGMAVTGTGNIGETTGIGTTAGFQFNTYVTSVDGNNITLSKPMSGYATGVLYFSPVSKVSSRLPVPVGSAVELLKQPMVLNALDSIALQSTGAGSGIGSTSTSAITQAAGSNFLTVTVGAAITNFLTSGMLIGPTGSNTGIQTNTFVGVGYTPGALSIPMTRPATVSLASTSLSFTEVITPQDGALQTTIVYQSTTDTSYLNGTGTVSAASSITTSVTAGLSTIPVAYYATGNTYPSIVQSIRVSNISDGSIYPGGDYPVSVGIGNSDTIFSWLAYNMVIPKNSSIELCESPKRIGIGQSIFAVAGTPYTIEIQIAAKQKI